MLLVRLNVLKYIDEQNATNLTEYKNRLATVSELLKKAKTGIENPKRAASIRKVTEEVELYNQSFEQVINLINKRNDVVNNALDPSGLGMRKKMSAIIDSANESNDAKATYFAAKTQEKLLLGRLYVTKFLVTNKKFDFERALNELQDNMKSTVADLDNNLQDPNRRNLFSDFKKSRENYIIALNDIHNTIIQRNNVINEKLNVLGKNIADLSEDVKLSVKRDQDTLGPQVQKDAEDSEFTIALISLISIVAGVLLSILMTNIIRKPIGGEPREIARLAEKIASGDLTEQFTDIESATGIYKSFINMTLKLQELIGGIQQTGNELLNNSSTAANISQQTTLAVTEQGELTAQLASAINEMAYSIQEVVDHAHKSTDSATDAQHQSLEGKDIVDQTRESINTLAQKVDESVEVIRSLELASNNIGDVIGVIKGISEQTNLLALNAAIEAARAGDQGRGFAVVADEVRGLAQRTQESTAEIQEIIQALQQGTATAVQVMEESRVGAQSTVERAVATGAALDGILSAISSISDINALVSTAVNEQSIVVEDINTKVTDISNSSVKSAEESQNTAKASEEIAELANTLTHLVSGFKVAN